MPFPELLWGRAGSRGLHFSRDKPGLSPVHSPFSAQAPAFPAAPSSSCHCPQVPSSGLMVALHGSQKEDTLLKLSSLSPLVIGPRPQYPSVFTSVLPDYLQLPKCPLPPHLGLFCQPFPLPVSFLCVHQSSASANSFGKPI